MALGYFLVLICILTLTRGHDLNSYSLAQELNDYCDTRSSRRSPDISSGPRGPVGKSGPRGPQGIAGPPGPEGIVNYTIIEEMVKKVVREAIEELQIATTSAATTPLPTAVNGWTVFQRRKDGSVNFNRSWKEYVKGFGNEGGEFWMGLEKLNHVTSNGNYELRIDLEDWEGNRVYAQYSEFSVGPASTNYRLMVSGYSGTAGDSLEKTTRSENVHNGMEFSTEDSDNDLYVSNCARMYTGGWWYNACFAANLNEVYYRGGKYSGNDGIVWWKWKSDYRYSMKFVEMKYRLAQ